MVASLYILLVVFVFWSQLLEGYATRLFPAIPEEAGGARPKTVKLALQTEPVRILHELGVDVDASSGLTGDVKLLYNTGEWIVLGIGKRSVSIQSKYVTAIEVER